MTINQSKSIKAINFLLSQWNITPPENNGFGESTSEIFSVLTTKKFRKSKLDDESVSDIHRKISYALDKKIPLEFTIPFGGYKTPWVESHPYINWADVFALNYLRRYAEHVASVWPNKIILTFTFCNHVMDLVNNFPL